MANPPVCRIMDYGKFRYEEAQKAKESRRKIVNVSVKEVKFRPKIGKGDFDVKVRKVDQFIHEGHKVKVTLQFRGREMAHPELGTKILDQVLEVVGSYVKVETQARLEGRNMSMVLSPDKKALEVRRGRVTAADDRGRRQHDRTPRRHRRRNRLPSKRHPETPPLRREHHTMPKMKTSRRPRSGSRPPGPARLRRQQAMRQHLFEKKSSRAPGAWRRTSTSTPTDLKKIKRLLGER